MILLLVSIWFLIYDLSSSICEIHVLSISNFANLENVAQDSNTAKTLDNNSQSGSQGLTMKAYYLSFMS
jgi:hypothetical protein